MARSSNINDFSIGDRVRIVEYSPIYEANLIHSEEIGKSATILSFDHNDDSRQFYVKTDGGWGHYVHIVEHLEETNATTSISIPSSVFEGLNLSFSQGCNLVRILRENGVTVDLEK